MLTNRLRSACMFTGALGISLSVGQAELNPERDITYGIVTQE